MSHKLTPKQMKAIHLLAEGKTATEVALRLKLRRETLSRWKRIPEFQWELQRLISELCNDMRCRLTCLVGESITAVSHGMAAEKCTPQQLKTAFSVLKLLGIDRMMVADDVEATIRRDQWIAKGLNR